MQSNTATYIVMNTGAPDMQAPKHSTCNQSITTHGAMEISRGCHIGTTHTTRLTIHDRTAPLVSH